MLVQEGQYRVKVFGGGHRDQTPLILEEGFVPATIADIMRLRLEGVLSFDNRYSAISGIAYAGNNEDRFKILPSSEELATLTKETELYDLGIKHTQDQCEGIKAQEFARGDMIIGRGLKREEVLEHAGWLTLAGDREILEIYTKEVFKRCKEAYGREEAMEFHVRKPQKVPGLYAWLLQSIYSNSVADESALLQSFEYLVGVRPEGAVLIAPPTLEIIMQVAQGYLGSKSLGSFRKELEGL